MILSFTSDYAATHQLVHVFFPLFLLRSGPNGQSTESGGRNHRPTVAMTPDRAAAGLLTRRFGRLILIAVGVSVLLSVAGLLGSFYLRASSGASIVLACVLAFALAWASRSLRSFLWETTGGR